MDFQVDEREELCRKKKHHIQMWVGGKKAASTSHLIPWLGEQEQGLG